MTVATVGGGRHCSATDESGHPVHRGPVLPFADDAVGWRLGVT